MLYRPYRFDGSANLIANSSFEANITGWVNTFSTNNPTLSRYTALSYSGNACLRVEFTGANSTAAVDLIAYKSVMNGKAITFTAWVVTVAANVRLTIQADNAIISPSTSSYHTGGGGWEKLSITVTPTFDSGGTTTYIAVGLTGQTNATEAFLDLVQLSTDGLTLPTSYGTGSWDLDGGEDSADFLALPRGRAWDAQRSERGRPGLKTFQQDCVLTADSESALLTAYEAIQAKRNVSGRLSRIDAANNVQVLTARLVSVKASATPHNGLLYQPITLSFETADMPWRGTMRDGSVTVTGAEGSQTIPNSGNKSYFGPVFTLTAGSGSVTAFSLIAGPDAAGRHWHWAWANAGGLAATKQLIVNCGAMTVTNDGASDYASFALDASHNQTAWAEVSPGGWTFAVTVTHSGTDPLLSWVSYDAY